MTRHPLTGAVHQGTPIAVKPSPAVVWLSWLIAALALIAAGTGLVWQEGSGPAAFTTGRGEAAQLYGRGLYRYDSLFVGAGNQGTDAIVLIVGIPLLVLSSVRYWRGSLRGGLLLLGTLVYFLYVYLTYAVGTAYNPLFLVYVALFSASLYASILAFASIDRRALPAHFLPGLPRRGPAVFMLASGLVTLVVWLEAPLRSLVGGEPPELLDHYTTLVTHALDLAIIVPAAFVSGLLILRRAPLGYLAAFSLLVLEAALAPLIAAQTISQVAAGVTFPLGQIIGIIGGFATLGALAIWVLVALLRHVSDRAQPPEG